VLLLAIAIDVIMSIAPSICMYVIVSLSIIQENIVASTGSRRNIMPEKREENIRVLG
jgi:hypothetical protein